MPDSKENIEQQEEKTPVKTQIQEAKEVYKNSGMFSVMKDYLPAENQGDIEHKDEKNQEGEQSDGGELPAPTEKNGSEEPPVPKLEEMKPEDLISEVKKNQKLVTDRDTELTSLKAKMSELEIKAQSGGDPDVKAFLEDLTKDFAGAWSKYREKLGLPDLNLISAQISKGDNTSRLAQWQEAFLQDEIEKQFKLEKGEFVYNPADSRKAGTASYEWDRQTKLREQELDNEIKTIQDSEKARLTNVKTQQEADKEYIKNTYFGGDQKVLDKVIEDFNNIPKLINEGKLKAEDHPFSLRNLIRGVNFETLSKIRADKEVADVVSQFNKLGFYLPKNENPTDISNLKGKNREQSPLNKEQKVRFSPMLQEIERTVTS